MYLQVNLESQHPERLCVGESVDWPLGAAAAVRLPALPRFFLHFFLLLLSTQHLAPAESGNKPEVALLYLLSFLIKEI